MSKQLEELVEEVKNQDSESEQDTVAGMIIELIQQQNIYLFHDQDGNAYARIERNNRNEILSIRGQEFKEYVLGTVWTELERPIIRSTLEVVVSTLEAMAKIEGKEHPLSLRTTWHDGALWYDLGDWRAVRIDSNDWEIVDKPPILFRKFRHQKVQPEPVKGGNLKDLLEFVNFNKSSDKQSLLLLTYLVATLVPDIPRPVLVVFGLQGSGKSTFLKVIKQIMDPSSLDLLTYPRGNKELIQMLSHHYLVFFDNMTELNDWQSDELCKACTGQAFSKRKLYADDEDVIYHYKRAIGINGINPVATKPDLLDRSIILELPRITDGDRMDETRFWRDFEQAKPRLLGALFSALSVAMKFREQAQDQLKRKPRMADYAIWGSAAALALGYKVQDFVRAYDENIVRQNSHAIDASPIAQVIIDFMDGKNAELTLSAKEWYEQLIPIADGLGLISEPLFPRSPNWIWKRIKPALVNLNNVGIEAEYNDSARPREITIKNTKNTVDNDASVED